VATVPNLLGTALLVDEEFLQAVLVGADEVLGVLDDVVEELERADGVQPEIEERLASISAEITRGEQALDRYYEAFEQGALSAERCEDRLTRLQVRLDDLHAQQAELSLQAPQKAPQAPRAAELAAVADQLDASSPRPSRRRPRRSSGC
jgi:exonuclease VII small subunit